MRNTPPMASYTPADQLFRGYDGKLYAYIRPDCLTSERHLTIPTLMVQSYRLSALRSSGHQLGRPMQHILPSNGEPALINNPPLVALLPSTSWGWGGW